MDISEILFITIITIIVVSFLIAQYKERIYNEDGVRTYPLRKSVPHQRKPYTGNNIIIHRGQVYFFTGRSWVPVQDELTELRNRKAK